MMQDNEPSSPSDQIRPYVRPASPEWFRKSPLLTPAEHLRTDIPTSYDPNEYDGEDDENPMSERSVGRLTPPGTNYSDYGPTTPNPGSPLTDHGDYDDEHDDDDRLTRETKAPAPRRDTESMSDSSLSELSEPIVNPETDRIIDRGRSPRKENQVGDAASVSKRHLTVNEFHGAAMHNPTASIYLINRRERALEREQLREAVRLNPDPRMIRRMRALECNGDLDSELENADSTSEGQGTVDELRRMVMLESNALVDGNNMRTPVRVSKYDSEEDIEVREAKSESEGPLTVSKLGKAATRIPNIPMDRNRRIRADRYEAESGARDTESGSMGTATVPRTEMTLGPRTIPVNRGMHDHQNYHATTSNSPAPSRQSEVEEKKLVSKGSDTEPSVYMIDMKSGMIRKYITQAWRERAATSGYVAVPQAVSREKTTCDWRQCGEEIQLLEETVTLHIEEHAPGVDKFDHIDCRWGDCNQNLKFQSLSRHVMTKHLPMKEYQCPRCGIFLKRLDALTRHVKKKTCLTCPKCKVVLLKKDIDSHRDICTSRKAKPQKRR